MVANEDELVKLKRQKKAERGAQTGGNSLWMKVAKKDPNEMNAALELPDNFELQTEMAEVSSMSEEGNGRGQKSSNKKESIRQHLGDALTRRLFVIPAFKFYHGIARLYDYGPHGCAVKANVLAMWHQRFCEGELIAMPLRCLNCVRIPADVGLDVLIRLGGK